MVYQKKIWIDLRLIKQKNQYHNFIMRLVNYLVKNNQQYYYNIYTNKNIKILWDNKNLKIVKTNLIPGSIKDQFYFSKETKNNKQDLFIFFDHKVPKNINKKYILLIPKLTELHFVENGNFLQKIFIDYLFRNSCNKAQKIICFNEDIKEEINDKLNIAEEKISIIPPALNSYEEFTKDEEIKIDIKSKYNIKWDFFIYDSLIKPETNTMKLVEVFEEIKKKNIDLCLLILNANAVKDVDFRKKVLEKNLVDKIFFIGDTNEFETRYFYKNTFWVIYPFLYAIFPFEMQTALKYNSNILASQLKSIKDIFWNKIKYFNPNNTSSIYEQIINMKKNPKNYKDIINKYKIDDSYEFLKKLIESI